MTDENPGTNCTDATKREAYRKALNFKIALESAQEIARNKMGEYRAYLKQAAKQGVSTKAITDMLAVRFEDPDLILIEERERIKMMELSGFLPGIRDKLLSRFDVEEATQKERTQADLDRAYDIGVREGRKGTPRGINGHEPGSEEYDAQDRGWLAGQAVIAGEMQGDAKPPTAVPQSTEIAKPQKAAKGKLGKLKIDNAATIRLAIDNDNLMPGDMPSILS